LLLAHCSTQLLLHLRQLLQALLLLLLLQLLHELPRNHVMLLLEACIEPQVTLSNSRRAWVYNIVPASI
jgi:hypothetical protein